MRHSGEKWYEKDQRMRDLNYKRHPLAPLKMTDFTHSLIRILQFLIQTLGFSKPGCLCNPWLPRLQYLDSLLKCLLLYSTSHIAINPRLHILICPITLELAVGAWRSTGSKNKGPSAYFGLAIEDPAHYSEPKRRLGAATVEVGLAETRVHDINSYR
jgi:hypothetical protein